jgi:hypothetical protein
MAATTLQKEFMRNVFRIGFLLVSLALPTVLHAQSPVRKGFWFNGGLGWGSLGCQDCTSREGGFSGNLALGGTISPKVLLGVGTNGWTKEEDGARLSAGTLTAQMRFYPSATGGFFLVGGLGVGTVDIVVTGFGSASETTFGGILGLGYDIRIGGNTSLTPFWNGVGLNSDAGDANFGQFGLGISIH